MAHKKSSGKKYRRPKRPQGTAVEAVETVKVVKATSADDFPNFKLPYHGLPSEIRLKIWKYLFPVDICLDFHPKWESAKCIKTTSKDGEEDVFGIYSYNHKETNFGSDYLLINKETHHEVKAVIEGGYLFVDIRPWNHKNAIAFANAIPKQVHEEGDRIIDNLSRATGECNGLPNYLSQR